MVRPSIGVAVTLAPLIGAPVSSTPQGSGENRPSGVTSKPANGVAQDVTLFIRFLLIRQVCFGSPAPRSALQDVTVVEKAIQHGRDRGAVTEQFAPVFHRAVGS